MKEATFGVKVTDVPKKSVVRWERGLSKYAAKKLYNHLIEHYPSPQYTVERT
jgi:hypothetical protein